MDAIIKSFSSAFDSIINTEIFYKGNQLSLLQAGIILILPQMAAYVVQYNSSFGIEFKVQLENYPLLLFILLVASFYVLLEPRIRTKNANAVFKLTFLSVHIFAFALSLNLIYAVSLQILGIKDDFLGGQIANASSLFLQPLSKPAFAALYGLPFLLVSILLVFRNSYRRHPGRMKTIVRSRYFWRTFALSSLLAVYQYMALILVGKSAG
jgi:uncharacterized protein with PQ loop repeat